MLSKKSKYMSWIAQLVCIAILGQTLYFKFFAHQDSVQLFTELGMEPEGRIIIGILELVACILLLIPTSVVFGALLGAGLMAGAVLGHITKLGWEGDRLSLGLMAVVVLFSCCLILWLRRLEIPLINSVLKETPK